MSRVGVLTNPHSGKNRGRPEREAELRRAAGRIGVVRATGSLDALPGALEDFFDAGCDYWVCDGGDGTLHWMLSIGDAIARRRGTSLPRILPANGGSIDFVAHKAGVRRQAVELLQALSAALACGQQPHTIPIDTFRFVGLPAAGGALVERIGFATALGGVAQRFFEKLYAQRPVEPRKIALVLANSVGSLALGRAPLLSSLLPEPLRRYADEIFAPTLAHVDIDGQRLPFHSFASLQVGAIDINLGGVVRTFRHAAEPGVMHAQAISMSPLGVTANLPNIVLGTPIWGKQVFDAPARDVRVTAIDPVRGPWIDPVVDGEMVFGLAQVQVTPGPALAIPCLDRARRAA